MSSIFLSLFFIFEYSSQSSNLDSQCELYTFEEIDRHKKEYNRSNYFLDMQINSGTESLVYFKLLAYGFIPETLTGLLASEDFGKHIIKNNRIPNKKSKITLNVCQFKLTRNNNSPRILGIIHPYAFIYLAREVSESWQNLSEVIDKGSKMKNFKPLGAIKPQVFSNNGRLINIFSDAASYDIKEIDDYENEIKVLNSKLNASILVKVDISNCYHSIYTHSVSWAAVGRERAFFEKKDKSTWHCKIDNALMFTNHRESVGLPIGPDTSAIIAEYIFSSIDLELKNFTYLRFIDDYKCYCTSVEEANKFILTLSNTLDKYHLRLNNKKTEILQLPLSTKPSWVTKLRSLSQSIPKIIDESNSSTMEDFLNVMVDLSKKHPHESPMKYGLKILIKRRFIDFKSYLNTCKYVFHLGILFPYLLETCEAFINTGYNYFDQDTESLNILVKDFICKIILTHVEYRRSDALSWAMYISIKHKVLLPKRLIERIIETSDPISTLFAYLYYTKRKLPYKVKFPNHDDDSSWWLYSYELHLLNSTKYLIKTDDYKFLNTLLKSNISFLNKQVLR